MIRTAVSPIFTSRKEARLEAEDLVRALGSVIANSPDAGVREMALQLMGRVIEREREEETDDDDEGEGEKDPRADWRLFRLEANDAVRESDSPVQKAGKEVWRPRNPKKAAPTGLAKEGVLLPVFLEKIAATDTAFGVASAASDLSMALERAPVRKQERLIPTLELAVANEG